MRTRICKKCGVSIHVPARGTTVTYHRKSGKWQAKYKQKYIGLYDTAEQAAEAIKEYKKER